MFEICEEIKLEIEEPSICAEHTQPSKWLCALCNRSLCSACKPIAYRGRVFCRGCIDQADKQLQERQQQKRIGDHQQQTARYSRRFAAIVTDSLLYLLVLYIIVEAAFPVLAWMGPLSGRLIAITLLVLYFTLFESARGGGCTPGKRFLRLRVVDRQGRQLTLAQSLWRTLIFCMPITVVLTALPAYKSRLWGSYGWIVFGYSLAVLLICCSAYLLFFNRKVKQLAHDWFSRSFIVKKSPLPCEGLTETKSKHFWVIGLLAFSCLVEGVWLGREVSAFFERSIDSENQVIRYLKEDNRISHFEVHLVTGNPDLQKTSLQLETSIWLRHKPNSTEGFRTYLAAVKQIIAASKEIPAVDSLLVKAYYGVDVGFFQRLEVVSHRGSRTDWQQFAERAGALRDLSDEQLADYLKTLPWLNKAQL